MAMTNEEAHALSRKRGTSRLIYGTARVVLTPIAAVWYRFKVTGAEYVPKEGRRDHRAQPQELLRLVLRRARHQAPPALHGQDGALRGQVGAAALRPRRLPGPPRDRRPRRAGDGAPAPRGGPRARALPRGHAPPRPGAAALAAQGRRAARDRGPVPDRPLRHHRHRPPLRGLVPAPGQGPGLLRPRDPAGASSRRPRRPPRT